MLEKAGGWRLKSTPTVGITPNVFKTERSCLVINCTYIQDAYNLDVDFDNFVKNTSC